MTSARTAPGKVVLGCAECNDPVTIPLRKTSIWPVSNFLSFNISGLLVRPKKRQLDEAGRIQGFFPAGQIFPPELSTGLGGMFALDPSDVTMAAKPSNHAA
jgi:hypothetical protein